MVVREGRGWAYFDPEYESLSATLNPPRVIIDNVMCPDVTVIKLDSTNRHGILLEIVQVLTDFDLFIRKAYVSSDGDWFMDAFHLTDRRGNKLTDEATLKRLKELLEKKAGIPLTTSLDSKPTFFSSKTSGREEATTRVSLGTVDQQTAVELTGPDRPGLLSDIFSVLSSLDCNVSSAEVWTHKLRVGCMIFINKANGIEGPIEDPDQLSVIKNRLCGAMNAEDGECTSISETGCLAGLTHTERRLHQMMSADQEDYHHESRCSAETSTSKTAGSRGVGGPAVTIRNCEERGYSVVNIHSRDRPKLLFDTVCTLTDLDYMIFHATGLSEGPYAYQEFYIRHVDGCTLETDDEQQRLIKRLVAAIERRLPEGLRLELCTHDRVGLMSDVTRVFYRHGLSVTRAYISTSRSGKVSNTFYVTDTSGRIVSKETVDAIRAEIGQAVQLQMEDPPMVVEPASAPPKFSLGSLFKASGKLLGFICSPLQEISPQARISA